MANILIRDVPEEIHRELVRQAEYSGRSLQQYLLIELERLSKTPALEQLVERIKSRGGGSNVGFEAATDEMREIRDERELQLSEREQHW